MKFSGVIDNILIQGSVSQMFKLGPSFIFMECRKISIEKKVKSFPFFTIKSKLRPK